MVNGIAQAPTPMGKLFPVATADTGRQSTPFHVAGMCSVLFNLMMIFIACFIFNNVA
jgi:hypothetical protein